MKPVILMTVHRRYQELASNLQRTWELAGEFKTPPEIVVVWACPEPGRQWFFDLLLRAKLIHHLLERPELPDERLSHNTTYPESFNLRLGLKFVKEHYQDCFVVVQIADICPQVDAYKFLDQYIHEEETKAIVFHWPNPSVPGGIWHTNFFCVPMDEQYWPPISPANHPDTLEWQWGKLLSERRVPGLMKCSNPNDRYFAHKHTSDGRLPWPVLPCQSNRNIALTICGGSKSLWQKLRLVYLKLKEFISWQK